jgi:hypothetical protein
MRKLVTAVSVVVLTFAVGMPAAFADGSRGKVDNVAATRAYLIARHRLMVAGQHDQRAGEAAVQALVARVKGECPGVLAAAPDNRGREDIRSEIGEVVPLTLERPARAATLAFAKTVQPLRWSNRKLTYYVTHAAREEAAKEEVPLPGICADAHAFAAGGFAAAPPTTERFLARSEAANSITRLEFGNGESGDLEERIDHLLTPYERPGEKALIPRKLTKRQLKRLLPVFERDYVTPVVEIARALGLPE